MRKVLTWPRHWHAWLAIALLLPFLIIAVTGILFAHGNAMGLRDIRVPVGWLPGYSQEGGPMIRSAARSGESWWLVAPQGLVKVENGQATIVTALGKEEVRSLQVTPQGLLAISAKGLWKEQQGEWKKILKGPVLQANGDSQTLTAVLRGKGPQVSRDGGASWQPLLPQVAPALASLPQSQAGTEITVAQLVHDLHTGKALVTDKAEWLWQDILGLALVFLAGSGFYLWWVRRHNARRMRRLAARNQAAASPEQPSKAV